MADDPYDSIVGIRVSRPNNRPLRGYSGSEYDRNRRMNTAANVSAGVCVAPIILGLAVLLVIEYERLSLERAARQRAQAKLEAQNSTNGSNVGPGALTDAIGGPTARSPTTTPNREEVVFPAEAVLAGVLFNRRRFFLGRSTDPHLGPCVLAAPKAHCLVVWQGLPPRFSDDFEYLAHSSGVTFSWVSHQAGFPWPSNAVRVTADTVRHPGVERVEEFYYGRSPGFSRHALLPGVVRVSESSKLMIIDDRRVRLFPRYELLVRNRPGYPVERWHQCQDRCNSTEGAVYGGFEAGSPTLVGRAYYDAHFSPCKVVAVGCVLPGGQVALIFEYLVESRGVVFEWVNSSAADLSSGSVVTVGASGVGRSFPLPPHGRLLLGAVPRGNASRLYASDGREPLAAPLDSFQLLVKRPYAEAAAAN